MRKDVVIAISIGLVIGLVITYGIWIANKSLKLAQNHPGASPTPVTTSSPEASPSPNPSANSVLVISSPEDESLSESATVTIKGQTIPNSDLVFFSEKSETFLKSDARGEFSTSVNLETGYNQLKIIVIDASGVEYSVERLVTYTTSKI